MDIDTLRHFLGWCAVINIGGLLYWMCFLIFAPEWTYRLHNKWLTITREQFNHAHYLLIGTFKCGVILFNISPYFALRIVA